MRERRASENREIAQLKKLWHIYSVLTGQHITVDGVTAFNGHLPKGGKEGFCQPCHRSDGCDRNLKHGPA